MKSFSILFLVPSLAHAATISSLSSGAVGEIPDGSTTGIQSSLAFTQPSQQIQSIEVSLELSATAGGTGYLGDLYLYLTDGTNLVTLMNRVGQDSGNLGGYADNQTVDVSFSAQATEDIHVYRESVTGDATVALSGPLTGLFQADGRITDPSVVITTDARTTSLADYVGLSADRTFTLFAADLSSGATHQIDSWSVTLTTVPEPSVLILSLLAPLGLLRRKRS